MSRIEEIKARLAKASPGPWVSAMLGGGKGSANVYAIRRNLTEGKIEQLARTERHPDRSAGFDAALMAHAPDDIAFLLSEVSRLSARVKVLEEALKKIAKHEASSECWEYGCDKDCVHGMSSDALSTRAREGGA